MKQINRLIGFFCIFALLLSGFCNVRAYADEEDYTADDIYEICEGIVDWASSDGEFYSENLVSTAGSNASDWLFIGYCRIFGTEGVDAYLQALKTCVDDMYATGNLENTKATEWQRIGLAVLAAGENPTSFGVDADGNSVNLVADGAFDHAKYSSLGRQGVNGWCFALILMDACDAEIPEDASYTREYIINEILSAQLGNGGFSLNSTADPDVTSIAIQALAPYYGDETVYTFESSGETISRTVGEAVDLALGWLSDAQLDDGDFSSYGTANAESTVQVILALTCLGIDPQEDARFIKNGNSCVDGLLKYRTASGGFAHALDDEGNATVENGLSSAQTLCGLGAYYRLLLGMSGFYEMAGDETLQSAIETEEPEEETEEEKEEVTETETSDTEKSDTDEQAEDAEAHDADTTETQDGSETQESLSETEEEEETYGRLVYVIAAIVLCLGVVSFVVMKKIGVEDDKSIE